MERKNLFKRAGSILLISAMVTGLFTGCGKEKTGNNDSILNEAASSTKDYVFKQADLGIDVDANNINTIKMVGDLVYAVDAYGDEQGVAVYSFNPDGSNLKKTLLPRTDEDSYNTFNFDKDGNIYCVHEIYHWEDDGEMHILEGEDGASESSSESSIAESEASADVATTEASVEDMASEEGSFENFAGDEATSEVSELNKIAADDVISNGSTDEERYLEKYDSNGKQIYRYDLNKDVDENDYLSVYSMIYTDSYGLIMTSSRGIEKFDENSGFSMVYDTSKSDLYRETYLQISNGFNGDIFISGYGTKGYFVAKLDVEKGEVGAESTAFEGHNSLSVFEGKGYDLYASTESAIYGYDSKSDKLEKILDYVDSDLTVDYGVSTVTAISDSEFLAVLPDFEYNYTLTRLIKVPADQVKDRQVITLGGAYIDYTVRQAAIKFNQNNSDYKIKLVDYSVYNTDDNWDEGTNRFNLDIVSGNIPDIMTFEQDSPVDSYINKGLFLDLNTMLKNDPELSSVEFVDSVMDAFKTGDKMYIMVPAFNIATVVMKASMTKGQDVLSVKDVEDIISAYNMNYNIACGPQSRPDMLTYGIAFSGTKYIDWENKKCNFNDESFVELLEFTKNFPDAMDDGIWEKNLDEIYRTNEALLSFSSLYGFDSFKRTKYGVFGEDVAFVGFPNSKGENYSTIYPTTRIAVSARTKNAEGAWSFLRSFYLEEYQDSLEYSFPMRKSSFDKLAKAATEPKYYTDEDGKQQIEKEYYWIGDQEIELPELTQEDVQFILNFVNSVHEPMSYNVNVNNIIMEEASAFYSGQKTAQEVADIIQSRLSIYVNENS